MKRGSSVRKQWVNRKRLIGRRGTVSGYYDYSKIKEISTAASVVLAAEYDRGACQVGSPPPAIDLHKWNRGAFQKLFEMGFFEIVGLTEEYGDRLRVAGDIKTMQIVSGTDAEALEAASKGILSLSQFLADPSPLPHDVFVALNTALSEAMSNVTRWAYLEDHPFKYAHVSKWWVTATADRTRRTLTVVLYDQGATIPATFPRKTWGQTVADFIRRNLSRVQSFEYCDDGVYIEGATKSGNTSSDRPWHGKGLPQMIDLIKICGNGSLTILSRGGRYTYVHGSGGARESHNHSIGGTLIEWELHLPQENDHG